MVKADRPDLEEQKAALTRQQNEYKILLKASPLSWTDRIMNEGAVLRIFLNKLYFSAGS